MNNSLSSQPVVTEGMLNAEQRECLNYLYEGLAARDGRHFSVIGRPGTGKKAVAYIVAKRLEPRRVAFLCAASSLVNRMKEATALMGVSAYCGTVRDVISDTGSPLAGCEVIMLIGAGFKDRRRLMRVLPEGCTVVSFITAGQEMVGDRDAAFDTLGTLLGSTILTYRTETVIDIRDVLFATVSEKRFIDNQILTNKFSRLEGELHSARAAEDEGRRRIAELEGIVAFHEQILNCLGIPLDEIRRYLAILSERKERLRGVEPGSEEAEALIAELQDEQAEILAEIRDRFANGMALESCEKELKMSIPEDLWRRLDKSSRSHLVTARYTFESMVKVDRDSMMDYSGVCLLITKAVEVESSRRFFAGYKDYLYKKYGRQFDLWPEVMLYVNSRRGIVRANNIFTLGSVKEILTEGGGDNGLSHEFVQYAASCLFSRMTNDEIAAELHRDVEFIERLREDFRNPAAHTGTFNRVGATQCYEYVVEVQRMLQKMIGKMDY